jgi:multicomponent K+:H+ antiporter subunit D
MPVAALFAIMTKVGAYSILRMYTLVFGPELAITRGLVEDWLLPAALLTLAAGSLGILGARKIGKLVAFAAIASMGTLLIAISLFTQVATGAALYYVIHSTFATGLMFLIADLICQRRGGAIDAAPPMPQNGLIASLFFAGAIALAGMPPLSGFIGKLLVMDAARDAPQAPLIWGVILITSLIAMVGFARAGSMIFWKSYEVAPKDVTPPAPTRALPFVAVFALLGALVALSVFSGPVSTYTEATAAQLFDPTAYIDAVLRRAGQ